MALAFVNFCEEADTCEEEDTCTRALAFVNLFRG